MSRRDDVPCLPVLMFLSRLFVCMYTSCPVHSYGRELICIVRISVPLCALGPLHPSSAHISFGFVFYSIWLSSQSSCRAAEFELCVAWSLLSDLFGLGDHTKNCCPRQHNSLGHGDTGKVRTHERPCPCGTHLKLKRAWALSDPVLPTSLSPIC